MSDTNVLALQYERMEHIRDAPVSLARQWFTRRMPVLGGPWWLYALAIGAGNLLRQLLLRDPPLGVQLATFVGTIVLAVAVVAIAHRAVNGVGGSSTASVSDTSAHVTDNSSP
jgi:hypothetical protein